MYRSNSQDQLEFPDFYLPFSGHLDPENRWIVLARLIPWRLVEKIYHEALCEDFGSPRVHARTAFGALLSRGIGLTHLVGRATARAAAHSPEALPPGRGPPRRRLGSHVGKPWDKVYAEMRKRFDTRTTAGRHFVFEHMLPDVDRGDLSGVGRWRRYRFYVDTHGILRKVKS